MKEQLLMKYELPMIESLQIVSSIITVGYERTGNKFGVNFNGSKGYLSNIEIWCEGTQKLRNNVIWIEKLIDQNGKILNKTLEIYHSEENGVRVSIINHHINP